VSLSTLNKLTDESTSTEVFFPLTLSAVTLPMIGVARLYREKRQIRTASEVTGRTCS
jgi:hypothetical protein